jgi:hypothetical protein
MFLVNTRSFHSLTFLLQVFSFYPQDPNYITFALSRSDVGTTNGGSFTIGAISSGVLLDHCAQVQVSSQKAEIPQEFSAIDNAVALPVLDRTSNFPQWVCLLDAIVIQGQETSLQASALLDTGTSLGGYLLPGHCYFTDSLQLRHLPQWWTPSMDQSRELSLITVLDHMPYLAKPRST